MGNSLKIALFYLLIGVIWIYFSDRAILYIFTGVSNDTLTIIQNIKGFFYIGFTACILYFTLSYFFRKISSTSEEYLRLFHANPNPMWVYDTKSLKFLAVNEAAIYHYGYSREDFLSMTILDIRPKQEATRVRESLASSPQGFYTTGTWTHITKYGDQINVKIYSHKLRFKNCDAEIIMSLDVTAQMRFEKEILELNRVLESRVQERTRQLQENLEEIQTMNEELAAINEEISSTNESLARANETIEAQKEIIEIQNRERLEDFAESIPDAFFVIDYNYRILRTNKALETLVGTPSDELINENIFDVFPRFKENDFRLIVENAFLHRQSQGFEYFSDRYQTHFRIRLYPAREGLIVYACNINDEVRQSQEVMLAKKNLEALINNTNDMIWSVDKNHLIISANRKFIEYAFATTGNLTSTGEPVPDGLFGEVYQVKLKEFYQRVLSGEHFIVELALDENADQKFFEIHFNPIVSDKGQTIGAGCFAFDITARKRAEEDRARLIDQLTTQNKNLEEFSYVISHNLRSPVASIKGLVNLIRNDKTPQPQLIDMLSKSADRLDEVIIDLNSVLETKSTVTENYELILFEDVVRNCQEILKAEIDKSNVSIITDFKSLPFIQTSKPYITSIIQNLMANAIKYRKDDEPLEIQLKSFRTDHKYCLTIRDNGLGIDLDQHKEKLFKLYKRFHTHVEGKGVGLYLVKTQVEAMNGSVSVSSKVGEGTEFTISLPA